MTPVEFLKSVIRKKDAKLRGRAETIRRLLDVIGAHELRDDAIRAWFRGELTTDPAPKPWFCMWCSEPLVGGRADAAEHVQQCQRNPLVVENERLRKAVEKAASAAGRDWLAEQLELGRVLVELDAESDGTP